MVDAARPRAPNDTLWSWLLALAWIPVAMGLAMGNDAIDARTPDTAVAYAAYGMAAMAGAVAAGFGAVLMSRHAPIWWVYGGIVAVPSWIAGMLIATDYGKESGAFLSGLGVAVGVVFFLGVGLTTLLVVALLRNRIAFVAAGGAMGFSLSGGGAMAALLMIVDMDAQAQEARDANEAPGLGLLLSLAALAGVAWMRRGVRAS